MSKSLYDWVIKQKNLTEVSDYGPIWESNTNTFKSDYDRCHGDAIKMLKSMVETRRDYTVFGTPDICKKVCLHYLRYFKKLNYDLASTIEKCKELDYLSEEYTVDTEWGRVSADLLRKVSYLEMIQKQLDPRDVVNPVFFEIGGGIGSMARVMGSLYPNCTYVICDLPETLFYSYSYLNMVFPGRVVLADEINLSSALNNDIRGIRFVLIPSRLRDQLPDFKVDLLINSVTRRDEQ